MKLSFVLTHGTLYEVMPARIFLAPVDDRDSEPNGTVIGYSVLFRETVLAYKEVYILVVNQKQTSDILHIDEL